jgi:hypothetical protein
VNTGQTFFSIGALTLLSLIVLRVNTSILYSDVVLQESKNGILANSIAVSIIEKASKKFFDEKTILGPPNEGVGTGGLTPRPKLGLESGETTLEDFNDFDDFNNYVQQDTFYSSIVFYSKCNVCYVNPANPDVESSNATWHKKLTVTTYSESIGNNAETTTDTFKLSTIYSYWYFQ